MELINFVTVWYAQHFCWAMCSSNLILLMLLYWYVCYNVFVDDQKMASPRRSVRRSPTKLSSSITSQVPASPRTCGSSVRCSPTELSSNLTPPITATSGIHPDMARCAGTTAGLLRGTPSTGSYAISQNKASGFCWNNHYSISINFYILTFVFFQLAAVIC